MTKPAAEHIGRLRRADCIPEGNEIGQDFSLKRVRSDFGESILEVGFHKPTPTQIRELMFDYKEYDA